VSLTYHYIIFIVIAFIGQPNYTVLKVL